ncbi:MAG: hypothetical protein ACOCZX_04540, partial [Candidatus Bipolaricaulota bacterium]
MNKRALLIFLLVFSLSLVTFAGFGAEETPREGGTLRVPAPYGGSITSLDPARTSRNQSTLVFRNIFENLVEIDPSSL